MNFKSPPNGLPPSISPMASGFALILILIILPINSLAHLPTEKLVFKEIYAGVFLVKLAPFPEVPQPGEIGEIIVYIEDYKTKEPVKSRVVISVYPSGEKDQTRQYTANRFGKGFYEVQHIWPKRGKYEIGVQFQVGDSEQKVHTAVQIGNGKGPSMIFLGLIGIFLVVAIALVAFLRKERLEICNKETSN